MIATPKPGLLIAIAATLALCTALLVPVGGRFTTSPGGPDAPTLVAERCIALSYSDSTEARWLPRVYRLQMGRAPEFDRAGHLAHRAVGLPVRLGSDYSGWRHSGRDSIDIGWHHSPVVRLPSRVMSSPQNEVVTGRAGYAEAISLAEALVNRNGFTVRAHAIACDLPVPVT